MRSDMANVIVERPRRGAGWSRKGRTLRDDDLELSESDLKANARKRATTKELNENLAPLRRYLERQIGRAWDEVWSEICANLRPMSTVQQHVRDHIPDFVSIKTAVRGGEVWVHDRWGGCARLGDGRTKLYVDPVSGALCRNEHWRSWQSAHRIEKSRRDEGRAKRMRVVNRKVQLHLFGECWWEVTLAEGSPPLERSRGDVVRYWAVDTDVVQSARLSTLPRDDLYGRAGVYAIAKRQLSRKEMRDLGLPRPH